MISPAEATEQGRAHQIGQRMRKDGSVIDVEVLIVPLVVHGEQLGYYAIYHDITELNAARREADSREPGQERVPGRDEPRDPDPDERRHRHERAAARHAARHRSARLRGDDP